MKEILRTTRPIGVCKYIPVDEGDYKDDPTAVKAVLDESFFIFDSNRMLYIRKGLPTDKECWVYTKEFIDNWKEEMSRRVLVMRDEFRGLLLDGTNHIEELGDTYE